MNGKITESRIITGMSIGLKGTKLLSIDAIDRSFLMAMKTIGKGMKMRKNHGLLMIPTCLIGSDSIFN